MQNEAIKLAIEKGGWQPYKLKQKATELMLLRTRSDYFRKRLEINNSTADEVIELEKLWNQYVTDVSVLDPLFWQALGKALGWKKRLTNKWLIHNLEIGKNEETWRFYAHQYFDLVLTGGNTDKFFKELLTTNK